MSSPPWSSPCRPRAPPAADGCIDGSQSPGPDPVLPAAPPPGALLEHSGHPGKAAGLQDAPLGGGPILARPTHRPRRTRRLLRATPRQAATPGPTSLRALTRVSSCATVRAPHFQPRPTAHMAPPSCSQLALFFCSVPRALVWALAQIVAGDNPRCVGGPFERLNGRQSTLGGHLPHS